MNIRRLIGTLTLCALTAGLVAVLYFRFGENVEHVQYEPAMSASGGTASKSHVSVSDGAERAFVYTMMVRDEPSVSALAIWSGRVIQAGKRSEECGLEVVIWNRDSPHKDVDKGRYCHLSSVSVRSGDEVKRGDAVGTWDGNAPEPAPGDPYPQFAHIR